MDFDDIKRNVGSLTMDVTALDVLLQFEKILDESGLYAYQNWHDGEVVVGPNIQRHWVEVSLMYPLDKMPEPVGGSRLIKLGCKVYFKKDTFTTPVRVKSPEDLEDQITKQAKKRKMPVWIIKVKMPRKLIDQEIEEYLSLDDIDVEVDTEEISRAYDQDLDGVEGTQQTDNQTLNDIGNI